MAVLSAPYYLPWRIDIDPIPTAVNTGWDTITADSLCLYGGYKVPASGVPTTNAISWDVVLAPGTWNLEVMCVKSSSGGILSIQIDGVEVVTLDSYAASITRNNRASTSITITQAGRHTLSITVPTKNASSSAFAGFLQRISLRRTA